MRDDWDAFGFEWTEVVEWKAFWVRSLKTLFWGKNIFVWFKQKAFYIALWSKFVELLQELQCMWKSFHQKHAFGIICLETCKLFVKIPEKLFISSFSTFFFFYEVLVHKATFQFEILKSFHQSSLFSLKSNFYSFKFQYLNKLFLLSSTKKAFNKFAHSSNRSSFQQSNLFHHHVIYPRTTLHNSINSITQNNFIKSAAKISLFEGGYVACGWSRNYNKK